MSAFLTLQLQTLTPSYLAGLAGRPSPVLRRGPVPPLRRRGRLGGLVAVKAGLEPPFSFGDEASFGAVKEVWERVEGMLYTVADAAVSSDAAGAASKQSGDWLSGITDGMETVLKILKGGLSALHVPYSYGFAIILLTVIVKAVTFPFSKKQVESAMAMRSLQPQVQAIQKRYAGDQEKIQTETARLYKLAGVNPLAGCLPTLATIPVWIGLYRALSNVANEGLLTEGFFWIPSLSGPTTIAAKQNGSGISWLFPFVDGHPPLGWSDTFAYLVLPLLLVVSQYISIQIMQSVQATDPNQKASQEFTKFLPLMIGYFSLSVPSGLSLYWFTNNILSTAQQIWLQKFGGAKVPILKDKETLQKEPPPKFQKSVPDNLNRVDYKVKETMLSEGPRPGERFKQIKEQEAKTRREREEKNREETSKQLVIAKEENKQENLSTTITHEVERGAVVNGVTSSQEAIEQKQSLLSKITNDDTSATMDVETDIKYSSQSLHEEKSVETHASEAENGSMESASYSRSNEPSDKNGL